MNHQLSSIIIILSVIHLAGAIYYFLKSDKAILLVSDSFVLASSLFIGLPGIMTAIWWSHGITRYNVIISGLGLAMTLVVSTSSALIRSRFYKGNLVPPNRCPERKVFSFWLYLTLLILVGAMSSGIVASVGADLGAVPGNFAYLAVGSSFLLFIISRTQKLPKVQKTLLFVLWLFVTTLYLIFYFDGGGRLIVATLFYGLAAILGIWNSQIRIKRYIILGLIPSLLLFGFIPLISYVFTAFFPIFKMQTFIAACILTAITLFILGTVKVRFTGQNAFKAGFEMLLVGGIAAIAAYGIGYFVASIL